MVENLLTMVDADGAITIPSDLLRDCGLAEGAEVTLEMIESTPGYSDRATLIRNFVRQDPERAALVVRDLIRSDLPMPEKA